MSAFAAAAKEPQRGGLEIEPARTSAQRTSSAVLYDDSRRTFEHAFSAQGLAGVEGGLGAAISGLLRNETLSMLHASSLRDEQELIEYVTQEEAQRAAAKRNGVAFKPPRFLPDHVYPLRDRKLYVPQNQKALESLIEEVAALEQKAKLEQGAASNFRLQVGTLVKQYKVNLPKVVIRYNNVTVQTDALVGSAGMPTVGNAFKHLLQGFVGIKPRTVKHNILTDIKGVLQPGKLTLLLGPPSSGKSSLLKVLAGRYQDSKHLHVEGTVTYNGHSFDEFQVNRTSAFIGQNDVHIPLLSVFDTLMFGYLCQQGFKVEDFNVISELRKAMQACEENSEACQLARDGKGDALRPCETSAELEREILDMGDRVYGTGLKVMGVMRAFGILHTKDTPVGDAMTRGVSGGERKRVTVAESLVGPRRVMFMDEISTGLDSATLYGIVTQMKEPPPEVYDVFDDVCLMSEGHVVYHGPVKGAVGFFSTLGFACPPRKDVPSFLQEVTTPSGQAEYATEELLAAKGVHRDAVRDFLIPTEEVVKRFWTTTDAGKEMQAQLDAPLDPKDDDPRALVKTRYALSPLQAVSVVTAFQGKLVLKDPVLIKGRLIQIMIIGLLLGGVFFQIEHTLAASRSLLGALFLSVMFVAMGSMPQLAIAMSSKPVWFKWRDNQFYPGWVHAMACTLAQFPVGVVDSMAWSLVTYWMWGLHASAGRFFTYFLILLGSNVSCGALFRMIAFIAPDGVAANSYGGLSLLILIVMSGFTIVRESIPKWWIWAYYLSPFAWAMRAVSINEMRSPSWNAPSTTNPGKTLGEDALDTFTIFPEQFWIWAGIGYLFGSAIFFTFGGGLALQYLSPKRVARVADEEELRVAREEAEERKKAADARKAAEAASAAECAAANSDPAAATRSMSLDAATPHQLLGQCAITVKSTIPFTPVTLVFQDLRYFVPNPSATDKKSVPGSEMGPPAKLELLKGITGFSTPFSLTALMGGSGAGKTTLMDCVAGRKTIGEITGNITVNGHPKDQRTFSRIMGYCEQMDIHTPALTVKESLLFSARLRLPASVHQDEMQRYVDEVMDIVELGPIQFDIVGSGGGNGLSVEQRKRLTIGVELVANPSVVFMDEPTSGLDARAAAIVMRAVRNVARNGRSVLVTIHQPSIEIFESFDNLLLLQRGGRTTYFGPLGTESIHLVEYLQAVPGCPPIRVGQNPSTWMLEVTGGSMSVSTQAVEADWPELYKGSALGKANTEHAAALVADAAAKNPVLTVEGGVYAVSIPTQMKELLMKHTKAMWRTPSYNYVRYITTALVAILYGSIYYKKGHLPNPATTKDVQNVAGVLFSSASFLGMTNMMAAMPMLGLERVVFYRERAASMYSAWPFGFALSSVETPYIITQVLLFVLIQYWMVGFVGRPEKFFWFLMMFFQSITFYTSFGMAMVTLTPTQQLAQVLGAGVNFLSNVFNGFVIPYPALARGFKWINRIMPQTWILYSLVTDQLGDKQNAISYAPDPSVRTVQMYLETVFGFDFDLHWYTPLMMLAYILVFRIAAVLALRYINFLKR